MSNKNKYDYGLPPTLSGNPYQQIAQINEYLYKLVDLMRAKEAIECNNDDENGTAKISVKKQTAGVASFQIGDTLIQSGKTNIGFGDLSSADWSLPQTVSVTKRTSAETEVGTFALRQLVYTAPEIAFPTEYKSVPQIFIAPDDYIQGKTDYCLYDFSVCDPKNSGFYIKSRIMAVGFFVDDNNFSVPVSWLAIGTV